VAFTGCARSGGRVRGPSQCFSAWQRNSAQQVLSTDTVLGGFSPRARLSDREVWKRTDTLDYQPPLSRSTGARRHHRDPRGAGELLNAFQLNDDRKKRVLSEVRHGRAERTCAGAPGMKRRNAGEPAETPQSEYDLPDASDAQNGGTLRVETFIQLHGHSFVSRR
jgi:hypothetical protein